MDMLWHIVCRGGSGRRGCGIRWRDETTRIKAMETNIFLWCPCCNQRYVCDSVIQQTARYEPRLCPAAEWYYVQQQMGTIHKNRNLRAAPSLTVGYTGNACTKRSESGQKWAALIPTALHGLQHRKGIFALIALKQATFMVGGRGGIGKRRINSTHPSHQNRQHLP